MSTKSSYQPDRSPCIRSTQLTSRCTGLGRRQHRRQWINFTQGPGARSHRHCHCPPRRRPCYTSPSVCCELSSSARRTDLSLRHSVTPTWCVDQGRNCICKGRRQHKRPLHKFARFPGVSSCNLAPSAAPPPVGDGASPPRCIALSRSTLPTNISQWPGTIDKQQQLFHQCFVIKHQTRFRFSQTCIMIGQMFNNTFHVDMKWSLLVIHAFMPTVTATSS